MDDFEKAIVISFDETGSVDTSLKSQATVFCQQIKENPSICSICIERLCFTKLIQVQFWCLQCLHDVIRVRYSTMSVEEKAYVRKSVFSMASLEAIDEKNIVRILDGPAFIKNKLAQIVFTLIYFEYPSTWPSVFVDFLSHLSKGSVVIDMFCRVLNALDDGLISLDYPRSAEEVIVAVRIKDTMRQQCIPQIVKLWYDIVSLYRNSDVDLCASVLECARRYILWIDSRLIVNNGFIRCLFELILENGLADQIRGAAATCVLAVVSKGMDYQSKITLLQSLRIRRVFGLVAADDTDIDLVSKVLSLLSGYAAKVLECLTRVGSEHAKGVAIDLLNEVLPSVFYAMKNCEMDATFSVVQFLSGYVNTMKNISSLTETQLLHLGQILEVVRMQIRFDTIYRNNINVLDKVGKEEVDRMADFRKDLIVLLRSIGCVAPDVTEFFIKNSLNSAVASPPDRVVEEVEAALTLFYSLGESLTDEAIKTGKGLLGELVPMLLSTQFPCHSNRLVALVYLNTITRYMKFAQENTQFIPMLLRAFLDERGIHHPNITVSNRASYLFMKAVKLLTTKLVPYIETILQSLQDKVTQFTSKSSVSDELLKADDGSHMFEAIGILIGMKDVTFEKQSEYLSALLTLLCQQVKVIVSKAKVQNPEESSVEIYNIQRIIMAINALSKGFSLRLVTASRPAIGVMFEQTLDVLLQVLVVFPKTESLRCKVTSYVHRMVDTLGAPVFPYIPKFLEQFPVESEPKELLCFLIFLNQLVCKFKSAVRDILEEVYPIILNRMSSILPRESFPSVPGGNTEGHRELQKLHRAFYTFLDVIALYNLSSVFLSSQSRVYLDQMMQLLLHSSCSHKDMLVRKTCVQIFTKLTKDWGARSSGEEKVPGFQNFVIESFATNCCLYSVLDRSFEFGDAKTVGLFSEIVVAQKIMYEKFGNDFIAHFVSKGLQSAHCPQDLIEQYCQKLQGNDKTKLISFYHLLIEKLRAQKKDNMVFQ